MGQQMRTTAVLQAEGEGGSLSIVASSERALTVAQRAALTANEMAAKGLGHAEVTAIRAADELGLSPVSIGITRLPCPSCMHMLLQRGIAWEVP
jgi:tRNA(Arg) A34 adenosine deaminase TadA